MTSFYNEIAPRNIHTTTTSSEIKKTYTTTIAYSGVSSRQSAYTLTTAYSVQGITVKTTGYSGVSVNTIINGYSGVSSSSTTIAGFYKCTNTTTTGYSGYTIMQSGYSGTITDRIGTQLYRGVTHTSQTASKTFTNGITISKTYTATSNVSSSNNNIWLWGVFTIRSDGAFRSYTQRTCIITKTQRQLVLTSSTDKNGLTLTTALTKTSSYYTSSTATTDLSVGTLKESKTSTETYYTSSSINNTRLSSVTVLTGLGNTYLTYSTAVGNMSNVTVLTSSNIIRTTSTTSNVTYPSVISILTESHTRQSNYITSSIQIGQMSSTTAITATSLSYLSTSITTEYRIVDTLIIKNNIDAKSYLCKTSYKGVPYLQINDYNYLDLTTNSTTGIYLKVKYNDVEYRPVQTIISTINNYITITSTIGYSGVTSRESTSGYTGISTEIDITGYSGVSTQKSTSAYSGRTSSRRTTGSGYRSTSTTTQATTGYSGRSYTTTSSRRIYSGTQITSWGTIIINKSGDVNREAYICTHTSQISIAINNNLVVGPEKIISSISTNGLTKTATTYKINTIYFYKSMGNIQSTVKADSSLTLSYITSWTQADTYPGIVTSHHWRLGISNVESSVNQVNAIIDNTNSSGSLVYGNPFLYKINGVSNPLTVIPKHSSQYFLHAYLKSFGTKTVSSTSSEAFSTLVVEFIGTYTLQKYQPGNHINNILDHSVLSYTTTRSSSKITTSKDNFYFITPMETLTTTYKTRSIYTSSSTTNANLLSTTALTKTLTGTTRYATTDYSQWYNDFTSTVSGTQLQSGYTTSTTIGNLYATTALTRNSYYTTESTIVGNMSSTTALTHKGYCATSSTAIGNMVTATALTRSSQYSTTSSIPGGLSSTTVLTKKTVSGSSTTMTTEA